MSKNLAISDHPFVSHRLSALRQSTTDQSTFRRLAYEITLFLAYDAFRDFPTQQILIETPVAQNVTARRIEDEVILVPILRAGFGLIPALQDVFPVNRVCSLGLRRDETTLEAEIYLDGIPDDIGDTPVVISDPMLATGGSLLRTIDVLRARGATRITALCLLATNEGIDAVHAHDPDVVIATAAVDPILNEAGYIVPGLGDAGDRLFGAPVRVRLPRESEPS